MKNSDDLNHNMAILFFNIFKKHGTDNAKLKPLLYVN